ncbi:MAG: hypothetical protein PVI65_07940, partial [Desulfobacterales bacterium]
PLWRQGGAQEKDNRDAQVDFFHRPSSFIKRQVCRAQANHSYGYHPISLWVICQFFVILMYYIEIHKDAGRWWNKSAKKKAGVGETEN